MLEITVPTINQSQQTNSKTNNKFLDKSHTRLIWIDRNVGQSDNEDEQKELEGGA